MKTILILTLLAVVEIILIGGLLLPRCVDRFEIAIAVANFHSKPTEENKTALNETKNKYAIRDAIFFTCYFVLLAANTIAIIKLSKRKKAQPPNAADSLPAAGS